MYWKEFFRPSEINRWQRPLENGRRPAVRAVAFFPNGRTALVVGDSGTLLKSEDAGQNWQIVASNSKETLRSIAVSPEGMSALAIGVAGTIIKSADAGQSWQALASSSKEDLYSVAFSPDGKSALVSGAAGTLLRSADAGQSWQAVVSNSTETLVSIAFSLDGKSAIAPDFGGKILRSADAGQTWQSLQAEGIDGTTYLYSVAFNRDGRNALAVGRNGKVFKSADAGQSWQLLQSPALDSQDGLNSVTFSPDGKKALAVGTNGKTLRSEDAGQTWQTLQLLDGTNLLPSSFSDRAHLMSVTFSPDGKAVLATTWAGTILKSDNAGQTWQAVGLYSKSPGPWFNALLAALAIAVVLVARILLAPGKTVLARLGILSNAVSDKPIDQASEDRLNFYPVVEALSKFLRHPATAPSLSIAINAAWGMGKSSFMNMLSGSLTKKGAKPVHFNVWHHQHEDVLLAPLLQAIVNQAIPGWTTGAGRAFRWRLWRQRSQGKWNWAFWWGSLAPPLVLGYLVWVAFQTWAPESIPPFGLLDEVVRDVHALVSMLTSGQWQASVKNGSLWEVGAAAVMAISSDWVSAIFVLSTVGLVVAWVMFFSYTLRPFPASPAILVASLDKRFSLSKAEAQTDFRQRFRSHFGQVARALQPKTMVIFIDDLDRCKPEKAAELLEAANYLSDAGPCFIILGIARDIVEAQVAHAHKLVAEEQAAMKRARTGKLLAKDDKEAQNDKDRLAYAQKYLRKLVQLDVALPRLEATRSIQLLLGKLGVDAQQIKANAEKKPFLSRLLWSPRWLWPILIVLTGVLAWRTAETVKVIEAKRVNEVSRLQGNAAAMRQEVEGARVYANWLGDVAAAKVPTGSAASTTALPPSSAASAAAPSSPVNASPLLYKAKADMMQTVVKDMEAGLAALEREAREGQPKTFEKLKEKVYQPGFNVYSAYTASAQLDGRKWDDIKKGLEAKERPQQAAQPGAGVAAPAVEPARSRIVDLASSTGSTIATENPIWNTNLGFFMGAMLILLISIFRAKDDYSEIPSPEYEKAVATWQMTLLQNPDTATPRELKRFMNLSRYAVARLQTATAGTTAASADAVKLPISEARIVELTAKWLVTGSKGGTGEPKAMRDALAHGGANADELALFLEIVGEMGDGSPVAPSAGADAGAIAKATSGTGTDADLDRTDKAEDV